MNQETSYETQRIDHLGIVAGICREISLVERIDAQVGGSQRKVSCGQAVMALVLNALGFSGRALYLMPEYLCNKPVELLIDEGLTAADFNDDVLGRGLDALYSAGVTEVFAGIAAHALQVYGIEHRFVHLDSSSFHLHGVYDSAEPDQEAIEVTHGYSRDHRPELKQAVVQLITSQASALPVWLEVLSGNSSDKHAFPETVRNYCRQLQEDEQVVFVMDSAGYSAENLASLQGVSWLMRVPETIAAAKELVRSTEPAQMTRLAGETYGYAVSSRYGDVEQRWLLVYSQAAYDRELEGLVRRQARELVEATRPPKHGARYVSRTSTVPRTPRRRSKGSMPAGATTGYKRVQAAQVNEVRRHARPGRPAAGEQPALVKYTLQGELVVVESALIEARCRLGKFIIATNVLEPASLSAPEMLSHYLSHYKEQGVSVERGFRFLKDPLFFAHSLFLKSPQRIMALLMVMGLALLVYALAERKLRQGLAEHGETIPDQKGKPTSTPTLRRVFQIFEGVDLLLVRNQGQVVFRQVLNLLPVHQQVLRLLGPNVANCYRSSA